MRRVLFILGLLLGSGLTVAPAYANGCASHPPGGRCATTTTEPPTTVVTTTTTVPVSTTVASTTTTSSSTSTTDPSTTTTQPETPCIPPNGEPHACDELPPTGFNLLWLVPVAGFALVLGYYLVFTNGKTGRERG